MKIFCSSTTSSFKTNFAINVNSSAISMSKCENWEAVLAAVKAGSSSSTQFVDICFDFQKVSSADSMDPLRRIASWHL